MPIQSTDIHYRLSGGASNTNPAASLGGIKSTSDTSSGIFSDVSSAVAYTGDAEHRCIYVHNAHASLTLTGAVAYLATNTAEGSMAIGVGTSAINGTEQTVANAGAAPAGVTFSAAPDLADGIALGDIPAGQSRALWLRRTIAPGAVAAADTFTLRVTGDTAA